jgi:hypothetical protein
MREDTEKEGEIGDGDENNDEEEEEEEEEDLLELFANQRTSNYNYD